MLEGFMGVAATSRSRNAARPPLLRGLRDQLRPLLRIAGPVVLAEVSWMTMGLVDTMMVGRVSAEAIGAVGIGSHVFFAVGTVGFGVLLGLDYVIAHAFGARRIAEMGRALVQGLYLATGIGTALTALLFLVGRRLHWIGIEPRVLELAVPYLDVAALGMLPLVLFMALRRYLQAIGHVRPILISAITANVVNAVANYALIFGHYGFPELGTVGAAWATTFARVYMLAFLAAVAWRHARREHPEILRTSLRPDPATLRSIVRLGVPAASQMAAEGGVFTAATLLAGRLDAISLAAHQIALGAAALSFMVPLGVSSAAAVRVGQALGARDPGGAVRAGWTALLVGGAFMALSATAFVLFPGVIVRAFTNDTAVIGTAVSLLSVAAVFQLFDGLQVVATGVLRGAGDTRTGMIAGLIGYWVLGLPVGAGLCFTAGFGVVGLWVGLSVGLIVVATALVLVWLQRTRALLA
jgi:MATE family multidrug resistance protein